MSIVNTILNKVDLNTTKYSEKLRKMGREIPEERIINVGAAIGTHVGPNACGLVYVKE